MTSYLVTGGAGFIGSHLCERLLDLGHQVKLIDDLSTGSFDNIQHLVPNPRFHYAIDTITNQMVLDRLASQCEVIVHLAAAVGVRLIVERPVHTIRTNIMGTEVVLDTALRYRCKVLLASTSEVYGKGNRIPFQEDDDVLLGPTSRSRWCYAASKMVDEFLGLAYCREKGLPVVVMRLFNTVGPRQTGQYGMVVPRFVQQALQGEPITVYGDGTQSRCFCDVEDTVRAILGLAESQEAVGQVFNAGSTEEVSIHDLAVKILEKVDKSGSAKQQPGSKRSGRAARPNDGRLVFVPYDQAYESGFEDMQRRVPSIDKIRDAIGWQPRVGLDDTLGRIISYYRGRI